MGAAAAPRLKLFRAVQSNLGQAYARLHPVIAILTRTSRRRRQPQQMSCDRPQLTRSGLQLFRPPDIPMPRRYGTAT